MRHSLVWKLPRSLGARIIVALVLVGLLPVLVAWGVILAQSRGPKAIDAYLVLLASHGSDMVEQGLQTGYLVVQTLAQDSVIRAQEGPLLAKEDRLRQLNTLFPGFHHLTLVDLEGRTLASSTYLFRGAWQGQEFFQRARAGQGAISPVRLSVGATEPWLSFAAPVPDAEGRLWAVLVGEMPVAALTSSVVKLRVGEGSYSFVVNSLGQVIAHPNSIRLMEEAALPQIGNRSERRLVTAKEKDETYLYALAPVAAAEMPEEWTVALKVPAAEAYAFVQRVLRLIFLVSLGVLLLIALVATALGTSISRPVRHAAAAARRMASGDLTVRVSSPEGGELGELAASFNTMAQELRARIQDLQDSRRRIVTLQEGVRREIAQQLHSSVQNKLMLLRHRLKEVEDKAAKGSKELPALLADLGQQLGEVQEQDLRQVTYRLYPSVLRLGLAPALKSIGEHFEAFLPVDLALDEGLVRREQEKPELVPEPIKLAAYRIMEEALTNVVKHAKATRASVKLSCSPEGRLHLLIRDDGRGFTIDGSAVGLGLVSMRDYAQAVDGTCSIRSVPGKGTVVSVILPLAGPG